MQHQCEANDLILILHLLDAGGSALGVKTWAGKGGFQSGGKDRDTWEMVGFMAKTNVMEAHVCTHETEMRNDSVDQKVFCRKPCVWG